MELPPVSKYLMHGKWRSKQVREWTRPTTTTWKIINIFRVKKWKSIWQEKAKKKTKPPGEMTQSVRPQNVIGRRKSLVCMIGVRGIGWSLNTWHEIWVYEIFQGKIKFTTLFVQTSLRYQPSFLCSSLGDYWCLSTFWNNGMKSGRYSYVQNLEMLHFVGVGEARI